MNHWSTSLKERINADNSANDQQLETLLEERIRNAGFKDHSSISEGNHTRLNAFWLFVGFGNSNKEDWSQVPRKSITLGTPHIFESIMATNKAVSKARYHKKINAFLEQAYKAGFVAPKLNGCLSYQYVGNLNVSDIVADNVKTKVNLINQKTELTDKAKISNVIKLINVCSPAFVVTNPGIFDVLKKHLKKNFTLHHNQKVGDSKLTMQIWSHTLWKTIYIRLPNHLSRCGNNSYSLVPKAIEVALKLGWEPI